MVFLFPFVVDKRISKIWWHRDNIHDVIMDINNTVTSLKFKANSEKLVFYFFLIILIHIVNVFIFFFISFQKVLETDECNSTALFHLGQMNWTKCQVDQSLQETCLMYLMKVCILDLYFHR